MVSGAPLANLLKVLIVQQDFDKLLYHRDIFGFLRM
jgi:hypothetical protein